MRLCSREVSVKSSNAVFLPEEDEVACGPQKPVLALVLGY